MMKEVSFVVLLDLHVRLRHEHKAERGRVEEFIVQVEVENEGRWRPVVRYDSAHGTAHRHRYSMTGREVREDLGLDFADALTFAEGDLRANWRRYMEEYSK